MRRREIIGTEVSITDYDEVLAEIEDAITTERKIYVCCAPASSLVLARGDASLWAALAGAEIVTPDGMGVVWAARWLGENITDRVYGPDLMRMQLGRSTAGGVSHFFYGGHDDQALFDLISLVRTEHPTAVIAGSHSPPHRALTPDETSNLVEEINNSGADVVWVGVGSPKQEIWMHELRDRLAPAVLIGVGAAFDFATGRVSQAPRWMQRSGLEWLYRIIQDPVRLGKRYFRTLPIFAFLAIKQRLSRRFE